MTQWHCDILYMAGSHPLNWSQDFWASTDCCCKGNRNEQLWWERAELNPGSILCSSVCQGFCGNKHLQGVCVCVCVGLSVAAPVCKHTTEEPQARTGTARWFIRSRSKAAGIISFVSKSHQNLKFPTCWVLREQTGECQFRSGRKVSSGSYFHLKGSRLNCFAKKRTKMSDFDLKTAKFLSLFQKLIFTKKVVLDEF